MVVLNKLRFKIQLLFTAFSNGYLIGFLKGDIYKGKSKQFCLPGLNCYSCPGAMGSCPIGALQSVLSGSGKNFSFYVLGTIILFGVILGRFVCGFLCPFGLFQDLLYKIKTSKIEINPKIDKSLRYIKYFILVGFVIITPIFFVDQFGLGYPAFCKYICPSGTLMGGIPLVIFGGETFSNSIGGLYIWKVLILCICIFLSTKLYRPFCKYLCPLGAFYGMFNNFSIFYRLEVDKNHCTNCKACENTCKMKVDILKNPNSCECIRCGDCINVCNKGCINVVNNVKK